FRVDKVKAMLLALVETNVVEDEELGLRAKVCGVRYACRTQVHLGLARNVARIAVVALLRDGINHVGHHHQGRYFRKWIQHECCRIGNEQHVALVDRCPSTDGGSVHAEAVLEGLFGQLVDGIRDVVPKSGQIGEPQVEQLNSVLLDGFQNSFRVRHVYSLCPPEKGD